MKKVFLKSMLLLCALIVGSLNVWGTLPQNPKWVATALGDIEDGATIIIISNSTTASNIALPSTATTSSPAKKACTVSTTDGITTITPPTGTTLQDLAWTFKKITADNNTTYKFYQEGSNSIRLYVGSSSNTGLKVGNASSNNDNFVLGSASKLLKVTTLNRYVGPYDNNGSDWRTYESETANNYKGATLTFYVLKTYSITAQSNDVDYGTVSLSNNVITGTPNDGYRYASPAYTVSPANSATIEQDGNTFTVSPSNNTTVTINFEAIPSRTITSATTLDGTITIKNGDNVITSGSSVLEGTTLTIIAEAGANKEFASWALTGATPVSTTNTETTFTVGENNVTIEATFNTIITHEINWSVNGVIVKTENVKEGNALTFVAPTSGIPGGYEYKGWSASAILTPQASETEITYVTEATSTENITYYAVMAVKSAVIPASITKMKKGETFTSGDKIVVAAIDEDNSFGMYQQTQSSSYVKNYSFSEDAEDIASDDKNWWTVTASSTNWILGDATNGRLYSASSTNLSVDAEHQTAFAFEDCNNGKFKLSYTNGGTKRYLCCRTDLTSDKKNLFRLSSSDGINELTLYKFTPASVAYSNFCTTVPAYTLIPTPDLYYTTFYDASSNIKLPDGVSAYWGEYDEGELTLKAFSGANADVVPAGHAVILKASSAASFEVTTTTDDAYDMTGIENDLIGSTGTSANANTYVLAYQGSPAATGFFKMTSGTIPAHKAYLDLTSGGGAPSAIRVVEENNNATSIEATEEAEKAVKFFENGQIYILREGVVYDALGRIVK